MILLMIASLGLTAFSGLAMALCFYGMRSEALKLQQENEVVQRENAALKRLVEPQQRQYLGVYRDVAPLSVTRHYDAHHATDVNSCQNKIERLESELAQAHKDLHKARYDVWRLENERSRGTGPDSRPAPTRIPGGGTRRR